MVIFSKATLALMLAVMASSAPGEPRHGSLFVNMNSVAVEKNGQLVRQVSGDETAATCSHFRLTASDAREFFTKATPVDAATYGHDLPGSNCVAAGRATTIGGTRGRWVIDLERRGELVLANGKRQYYYCAKCSSARYDEADPDAVN